MAIAVIRPQAVGQICSTSSLTHNLEQCVRLIRKAAVGGAKVLFLPEAADFIGSSPQESLSLAQPQDKSPFVLGIQEAAKKHSLAVNVGIHVPLSGSESCGSAPQGDHVTTNDEAAATQKLLNRSLWVNADGAIDQLASYDKLHLFDYAHLRESDTVSRGRKLTPPFASPLGRIGSLICFDLRFPEAALALAQPGPNSDFRNSPAQVLLYPSAFTISTGKAHWETLLRARAIETESWVIASAQVGKHNGKRSSYGHSMVVDPWGRVKLELGGVDEEGQAEEGAVGQIGFVDIDLDLWQKTREGMPLGRRTDVYSEL